MFGDQQDGVPRVGQRRANLIEPVVALANALVVPVLNLPGALEGFEAVFLLCSLGWIYDPVLLGVAAVITLSWWRWGRRSPAPGASFSSQPRELFWLFAPALVGLFYGPLYLLHGLSPEIRADGIGYHLGLVGRYYRDLEMRLEFIEPLLLVFVAITDEYYGLFGVWHGNRYVRLQSYPIARRSGRLSRATAIGWKIKATDLAYDDAMGQNGGLGACPSRSRYELGLSLAFQAQFLALAQPSNEGIGAANASERSCRHVAIADDNVWIRHRRNHDRKV